MGFLSGSVTALRFAVDGGPAGFDQTQVDSLAAFAAGQSRIAAADGVEVGWAGGGHVLDTRFSLEKNVVGDALAADLRVDVDRLPGDLLQSYYQTELAALSAHNPSGLPSARQKREARENARDRLEQEAKDGRYKRRTRFPVLWDRGSGAVWFGNTAWPQVDRLASLFQQTFGLGLTCETAGRLAGRLAGRPAKTALSAFVPGVTPADLAWIADDASQDFLGTEFLTWLWFNSEGDSETVKLADGSEVTYMIARTLTLDCPRGQTGSETIRYEGPSRLPEAKRALQSGKLPRAAGLTLVRHDQQYEVTLQAETMAVRGGRLPKPEDDGLDTNGRRHARLEQCRHLFGTLDGLYGAFLANRLGAGWAETLPRIQRWLTRGER